jgi:hypothetical protein
VLNQGVLKCQNKKVWSAKKRSFGVLKQEALECQIKLL